MSRQLRMQARIGGQSAKPEESATAAACGEPDIATASARFDDFSDVDLLALYQEHARGSPERTAACEVLESEVAGRLGVTPEELLEARRAGQGFSAPSLNAPVGHDEDSAERHWHELPRREQQILLLRFYGNQTQEQVAAQLGLSQMHVSRLQARALARLRDRLLEPAGSALAEAGTGSGGDA
jgi:DNA-directed RNA polymerase specialized sigma24 family protein